MVVLGDVFLVIAYLFGVCLSTWALVLGVALLFPSKAARAEAATERHAWPTFFVGLGVFGLGGVLSLALLAQPLPGAKLLGFIGLLAILSVSMLGMTGVASLVGQRIRPLDPDISRFRAISRGAGLLVVAGLLPLVGWFVFFPLLLIFSTGAGLAALMPKRIERPATAPGFDYGAV